MMHTSTTDPAVASAKRSQELRSSKKNSICENSSLPFKKRRLLIESTPPWEQTPQATGYDEQTVTPSPAYNINSEERIAALALVAAAANACFPLTSLATGLEPQVESTQDSGRRPSFMFNEYSERNIALHLPDFDGILPVTPTGVDTGVDTSSVPLSDCSSRRIHHPPLAAPLPGGCHGRTSRNNSYCRRNPCYNGSRFCKLHYQQQYTAAVVRLPPVIDAALSEGTGYSDSSTLVAASTRQDKRYTGCDDEVRCLATTTRGRPCAYVSVFTSKYCFLHADYDTNPPPRRGGSGSTPKQGKAVSAPSSEIEGCPPIPDLTSWIPSMKPSVTCGPSAGPPSYASHDSSSSSSSRSDMEKANSPPQLIDCPLPLLSSISSDQWLNKNVLIGLGPLVNHIGQIMKWGNGWVSLRIQSGAAAQEMHGGLLHNRRSVELFLLPPDQQNGGQHFE